MDFEKIKNIAIVGLSANPERASYKVAAYLQEAGYNIIPVNPTLKEVLEEKAYSDLLSIPKNIEIDVVDIFRRSEAVPQIVDEALQRGTKTIWMQEGVVNNQAAEEAEKAGVEVIMDKCLKKEHAKHRL